jgi:hypothetical protein
MAHSIVGPKNKPARGMNKKKASGGSVEMPLFEGAGQGLAALGYLKFHTGQVESF